MSKRSQSGLGSIQREFSEGGGASSQESVFWPPTPPPVLSAQEQRLKAIREALAKGASAGTAKVVPKQIQSSSPLATSTAQNNKRPNPSGTSVDPPAKKPRELPSSWGATSSSSTVVSRPTTTVNASKAKLAPVFLSNEQTHILRLVQEDKNVFYTGSAGTGKSVLLREIIKALKKKHARYTDAVAVTASTGIAACNIGGVTIHSFAGIGLGVDSVPDLVKKIKKNRKASTRWLRTKVLIIDEVSMLEGDLFDKLAKIAQTLRKTQKPFGGIQVIVTGDFFQLPPVTKGQQSCKFAFEADLWGETIENTFNLTKVFRQRDQDFVDMLNEMRFGTLSQKSIDRFRSLSREIRYDDGIGATELFSHRADVDRSNSTRMRSLRSEERVYLSRDSGGDDGPNRDKLLSNFMAQKELTLRINAQVMLIKNIDEQLVNGSLGSIVAFMSADQYAGENEPVKPPSTATTAPKEKTTVSSSGIPYPVVDFILASGGKRRMLVIPEQWRVELPSGEIQASRSQLPLILSWAMSIHKSQGQTLERVIVDLGKVFEKGQAYVALSRATSMEGLQVLNFDPRKVQAHPKVVSWVRTLKTVGEAGNS